MPPTPHLSQLVNGLIKRRNICLYHLNSHIRLLLTTTSILTILILIIYEHPQPIPDPPPFPLSTTDVYNRNYPHLPPSSPSPPTTHLIRQIRTRLNNSLSKSATPSIRRNLTSPTFHPLHALAADKSMHQFGYAHHKHPIDPLCLPPGPSGLARTPLFANPPVTPMCLSLFQNAYLATCGIILQPTTRTIFDLAGGSYTNHTTPYTTPQIPLSARHLATFRKHKASIVLSLAHHHSTTYHHVIHELLARYLLVVPLLDAMPDILVAVDHGHIAPRLLTRLGLSPQRILHFSNDCQTPQWTFAGLILSPMPINVEHDANFYAKAVTRNTAAILRETLLPDQEPTSRTNKSPKRTILLIERAKTRSFTGSCSEARCLKNLRTIERKLRSHFSTHFQITLYKAAYDIHTAIEMFSDAHVVIGVHGAGFQNLMFCRPNTTVVHIGPRQDWYQPLVDELHLNFHKLHVPGLEHGTKNYILRDVDGLLRNVSSAMRKDGLIV